MKKNISIFLLLSGSLVFFFFCLSIAAEKPSHPEEIILMDYEGNEISLDSNVPYSPKKTCGECHDYDEITNAYHFQLGRTDANGKIIVCDDYDSKNPWLLSGGMYGKW